MTQTYARHFPSVPNHIPAEIGSTIFKLAMELDDSFAEAPVVDVLSGHRRELYERRPGSEITRRITRRSIPLVCRQWNLIAASLSYQHVTISSPRQFEQLLWTLQQTQSPFGALVKRLDVGGGCGAVPVPIAVQLMEALPGLVTLVLRMDWKLGSPLDILNALPASLQNLSWWGSLCHDVHEPSSPMSSWDVTLADLSTFMNSHPSLKSISLPFFMKQSGPALAPIETPSPWGNIEEWTFQHSTQLLALARGLPPGCLRNLKTVRLSSSSNTDLRDFSVFQAVHGQTITCISVPGPTFNISAIQGTAQPSLSDIEISYDTLLEREELKWFSSASRIDSITTLRIRLRLSTGIPHCTHMILPSAQSASTPTRIQILHHLVSLPWTKFFPQLRRIRIMDELDAEEYRTGEEITVNSLSWSARWSRQDIVVEDLRGNALGQFTKGISTWVGL